MRTLILPLASRQVGVTHLPSQIPMLSGKTGRNDPCPCGSGKKYKQCCLIKQATPAQPQALDQATAQLLMDGFALYRGARWDEFEELNGKEPLWRIPSARMKGDLDRKEEADGDHLVPLTPQAVAVLKVLWPLTGEGLLLFPSNRHTHRPMSENATGYLLNRAGYHGHHVPHGFRAAFSTIMNEWAEREGKDHDRKVIDLMLAHVPKEKVEGAYNRAAYMPRRRELAQNWADMLVKGLPAPAVLVERPAKVTCEWSRRIVPKPVPGDFRFRPRSEAA